LRYTPNGQQKIQNKSKDNKNSPERVGV